MLTKQSEDIYEKEREEEITGYIEEGKYDFFLFCEKLLGITLHRGQLGAVMRIIAKFVPTTIILAGNRSGKTVLLSCYHIWKLFYKHGGPGKEIKPEFFDDIEYVTANLAPHSEQTLIIYEHITKICRGQFAIRNPDGSITTNKSLIRWFIDAKGLDNPSKPPKNGPYQLNFSNGSIFKAYTLGGSHGDTIQGRPYAFITYDEFGRSKDPYGEYDDIKPRLLDWNGEFIIITTPDDGNEDASQWLDEHIDMAHDEASGFRFLNWATTDNPHMSGDAIDNMLRGASDEKRQQILGGIINLKKKKYFPSTKIEIMFLQQRVGYKPIDFINHLPIRGHLYAIGLDTSGMGKDQWSLYVYDVTELPFKKVFDFTSSEGPSANIAETRRVVQEFYAFCGRQNVEFTMDATAEGGTIVQDTLLDLNPIAYKFSIEKHTGRNMKVELLTTYRKAVQEEAMVSPEDEGLKGQLRKYKGPQDDKGQKTDRIMASALAIYAPYERTLVQKEEWIVDMG